MDEQIIRTLQEQAIEERQYIQEKYGQDEDVVQVVNRRDYLTGRQSAAVRLYAMKEMFHCTDMVILN